MLRLLKKGRSQSKPPTDLLCVSTNLFAFSCHWLVRTFRISRHFILVQFTALTDCSSIHPPTLVGHVSVVCPSPKWRISKGTTFIDLSHVQSVNYFLNDALSRCPLWTAGLLLLCACAVAIQPPQMANDFLSYGKPYPPSLPKSNLITFNQPKRQFRSNFSRLASKLWLCSATAASQLVRSTSVRAVRTTAFQWLPSPSTLCQCLRKQLWTQCA